MRYSCTGVPTIAPYKKERGAIVIIGDVSMILPEAALKAFDGNRVNLTCTTDTEHDKSALLSLRGICYRNDKKKDTSLVSCDGIIVDVPLTLGVGTLCRIVCEAI